MFAFESVKIPGLGLSVSLLSGICLYIISIIFVAGFYQKIPVSIFSLFPFLIIGTIVDIIGGSLGDVSVVDLTKPLQWILLVLISYNYFLRFENQVLGFYMLAVSAAVAGIFHLAEIGVVKQLVYDLEGVGEVTRMSGLGSNPNFASAFLNIGFISALMLLVIFPNVTIWKKVLLGVIIVITFLALMKLASRTGIMSLFLGVSTLLFYGDNLSKRFAYFGFTLLVLVLSAFLISESELLSSRIMSTLHEGDTSSRSVIWRTSLGLMDVMHPFGYGLSSSSFALGEAMFRGVKSTHNSYIWAFLSSGLLGLFSYLFFLGLVVYKVASQRNFPNSTVAFALCVMLFSAGITINVEVGRWFWVVLGMAVAIAERNNHSNLLLYKNNHLFYTY